MRSEGFYANEKFQMTPAWIEPVTFRFVAQHIYMCVCVCVCVENMQVLPDLIFYIGLVYDV